MGSPGPGEDEVGIVYATFRGPDAINRAVFQVFPNEQQATQAFEDIRAFAESGRDRSLGDKTNAPLLLQAPEMTHPSMCLYRRGLVLECDALVGRVIVAGEAQDLKRPFVRGNRSHALTMLEAGVGHLESVRRAT